MTQVHKILVSVKNMAISQLDDVGDWTTLPREVANAGCCYFFKEYSVRQSMDCKHLPEFFYGSQDCDAHGVNFYPFRVRMYHYKKHLPHTEASKVQM